MRMKNSALGSVSGYFVEGRSVGEENAGGIGRQRERWYNSVDLRCFTGVVFCRRVVEHVRAPVQNILDDDENDEGGEHDILDQVKVQIPACWALPAGVAWTHETHDIHCSIDRLRKIQTLMVQQKGL